MRNALIFLPVGLDKPEEKMIHYTPTGGRGKREQTPKALLAGRKA